MKAIWQNTVIASSSDTIEVEGRHYFPPKSVNQKYLQSSDTPYTCWWRGVCTYFDLKVGETEGKNFAWTFEHPPTTAIEKVGKDFSNYVAFWHSVTVE